VAGPEPSGPGIIVVVTIPNLVRARSCPCMNACINNLRQMDGAVQQWALENQKSQKTKSRWGHHALLEESLVCRKRGHTKSGLPFRTC